VTRITLKREKHYNTADVVVLKGNLISHPSELDYVCLHILILHKASNMLIVHIFAFVSDSIK
jgi:hypothetical protein